MGSLLSAIRTRFFDKSNKPLAGGKVYTYEANTTNPKVTWSDEALTIQNTNPVLLDNEGTALIFFSGKYRFRILDSEDVLIEDNPSVTSGVGIDGVTADIVKDGDLNQKQINDAQKNLNLTIINYVNPKMFGAVGDGIANDAQAIRDCFNYIIANKATFNDFSNSKYRYDANILVSAPNQKIIIDGNCEFISEANYITFSGTKDLVGNITVAASKNSKSFTINQSFSFATGDLIAIHNSRESSLSGHRTYYFDGEYKTVDASSSATITLQSALETSYPGGVEDKVWKINPIILDIRGVKFTSKGLGAIKISLAAYSYFNFNAENPSNSATAQNAFYLDRSYSCHIGGGRYIKSMLSGSGTDYGITIGNSQDILNEADYAFGARHGCAIGGDAGDMAVPNRRIHCEKITIENDPTSLVHAADFHGNAIDSHYKECLIKGRISLSGLNVKSMYNKITPSSTDIRAPIGLSEVVGGRIESIGDEIVSSGAASYIMGWLASSTVPKVSQDTTIVLQDVKFASNDNLVGILSVLNLPTKGNAVLDGFELVGVAPLFTRILNYSAGPSTTKPSYLQATRPKYAVSDTIFLIAGDASLADVPKQVFPSSGSNANGSWTRNSDGSMVCRFRVSTTLPITTAATGGFKSADIPWTYPKAFIAQPQITAMSFDNASASIRGTSSGTSSAQLYSFSNVSIGSAGINFDVTASGRFLY